MTGSQPPGPHVAYPAVPERLELRAVPELDVTRLHVAGQLDVATVPTLGAEIAALRAAGARRIVIDMRRLEFMDSTGLRCILECDAEARKDGFSIALVPGPPAVQRVFELTRTEERLPFIDS